MPLPRPVVLALLVTLPVFLAACTLPEEFDPRGEALEPVFVPVAGLTPEHQRSHPVAIAVDDNATTAFIALAGTIARPDARVAVLDLERGRLRRHIDVGLRPLDLVRDPVQTERLLVTHPYHPSITVLDIDDERVMGHLQVPYYVEHVAFTPDGERLIATNRDQDVAIVYGITRTETGYTLKKEREVATGPNPEWVVVVPRPDAAQLAAVSDRHGASVTLIDLDTGRHRSIAIGGPPLHLAADAGLLLVAGYGPGNGTAADVDGTSENGTADVENSLLLLDLRAPLAELMGDADVPAIRYLSDTAHPDRAPAELRVLAGASLRDVRIVDHGARDPFRCSGARLAATYQGTDQVQLLCWDPPARGGNLTADILRPYGGAGGERLSALPEGRALEPGALTDTRHAVFETPAGPRASLLTPDGILLTVSELTEMVQALDLADCPGAAAPSAACTATTIAVVDDPLPYPTGIYEEGERLFHSALPSADQDRSCAACHIDGLATGDTWALPHRDLTPVRVPRLDDTADNAPWLLDGSARTPADYLQAAAGDMLRPDFTDPNNRITNGTNATNAPLPRIVDGRNNTTAWMDAAFAYLIGETRILPIPPRPDAERRDRGDGRSLFEGTLECMSCHTAAGEATLLTSDRSANITRPPNAERIKAPSLDGLWDRRGTGYLWTGQAPTIPSVILPDGDACLEGMTGFAGTWHGSANDRTCGAIADLTTYLLSLEGRR